MYRCDEYIFCEIIKHYVIYRLWRWGFSGQWSHCWDRSPGCVTCTLCMWSSEWECGVWDLCEQAEGKLPFWEAAWQKAVASPSVFRTPRPLSPPTTLFQVLPQVLPQMQPELPKERGESPRHAPLPGGSEERVLPLQTWPFLLGGGVAGMMWPCHPKAPGADLCTDPCFGAWRLLGVGQLYLHLLWLPREASLESHLRRC